MRGPAVVSLEDYPTCSGGDGVRFSAAAPKNARRDTVSSRPVQGAHRLSDRDGVNTGPTIVNGTYPDAGMTMEQAQRNLVALGYKGKNGLTLAVDGKYGENTAYALKSFQAANGLAAHGYLDSTTADKLIVS